jgi:hypothetical protein
MSVMPLLIFFWCLPVVLCSLFLCSCSALTSYQRKALAFICTMSDDAGLATHITPHGLAAVTLGVCCSLGFLSTVTVALRSMVRWATKHFGYDDGLMVVGLVSFSLFSQRQNIRCKYQPLLPCASRRWKRAEGYTDTAFLVSISRGLRGGFLWHLRRHRDKE